MLHSKQHTSKLITVSQNLNKSDTRFYEKLIGHLSRHLTSRITIDFYDSLSESSLCSELRDAMRCSAASASILILLAQSGCSQHECERTMELCGSYDNKLELQMPGNAYFEKMNQGSAFFKVNNLSSRVNLKAYLVQGDKRSLLNIEEMNRDGSSSDFQAKGDIRDLSLGKATLVLADDEQPLETASLGKWPQLSVVYRKVEFPTMPSAIFTDQSALEDAPSPVSIKIRQRIIYSYQTGFKNVRISKIKLYKYNEGTKKVDSISQSQMLLGDKLLFDIADSSILSVFPDNKPTPTFSYLGVCPSLPTVEQLDIANCMTLNGKIPDGMVTKPMAADKNGTYITLIDSQDILRGYMVFAGSGNMNNFLNLVTLTDPPSPKKTRLVTTIDLTERTTSLPSDVLAIKEDGSVETYLQATDVTGIKLNYDSAVAEKNFEVTGAQSLSSLLNSSDIMKTPVSALAVGDIDGDGSDDIAAVRGKEVSLLLNQSYVGYKPLSSPIVAPWSVDAVAIGDVNNDSKADVVVANTQTNSIAVFLSK